MKVSILCTDPSHPVVPFLRTWCDRARADRHEVALCFDKSDLPGGDVLFLVSCAQLVREKERSAYRASLVLHASDLPLGRGWSPHVWSVLQGADEITVCLIEAADPVDTGRIWLKRQFRLEGHELLPEINQKLFALETTLMSEALQRFESIVPTPQSGQAGSYCRRRTAVDSKLDVKKSIEEQFDLLRVVDNDRYPAFIEHRGKTYLLKIEKQDDV